MNKEKIVRRLLMCAAVACFVIAALLIAWSFISKINFLEEKYLEYTIWLSELEYKVAAINNLWLLILVIMLLYFVKTAIPLYPVSIICVATALVFKTPVSFVINISGMILLFTVKYSMGTHAGGGGMQRLIRKSQLIRKLIESDGQGNPWILFIFRLVPVFPVNPVSQIYGAMNFPFWKYILISVVGYMPRMAFYIVIGRNVSNPFSLKFSLPLIMFAIFSGLALLMMWSAWNAMDKFKEQKQGEVDNV